MDNNNNSSILKTLIDFAIKISKASVVSKVFIVEGIIIMIMGMILEIAFKGTEGSGPLLIVPIMGFFFIVLGLLLTGIFKQNIYVGTAMIFILFSIFFIPFGIIFKNESIIFTIASVIIVTACIVIAIILLVMAKKEKKLKLYVSPKVIEVLPKETVLNNCITDLNNEKEPWIITVENDSIVAKINWKDTTNLSFTGITKDMENFEYRLTLNDDHTYSETMITSSGTTTFGPTTYSADRSFFIGTSLRHFESFEIGIDNKTGEKGVIKTKFSTDEIRDKIRYYVEERGFKSE